MPPIAFLRRWLLILLPMLFLWFGYGTFSNFVSQKVQHFSTQDFLWLSDMLIDYVPKRWRSGPSTHLLNIACLFIIWRTVLNVKRRIDQWEEHQVHRMRTETNQVSAEMKDLQKNNKVLTQRLKSCKKSAASTKLDIGELEESCKAYKAQIMGLKEENNNLKAKFEQEHKIFDADRETLERKLEKATNLLQEKDETLQQKLAQELLHCESNTKLQADIAAFGRSIVDMTTEREECEDSYKTQIKELEQRSSDLEDDLSSAKHNNEVLKRSFERERQIQQNEVDSVKTQLEKLIDELQDADIALKKELAEKEASTVQTNEQFLACREAIHKVAKERQNFLKDEIRLHQSKAYENWVAYREADKALARERTKTADLHRKLEKLNNKVAENSGKSQASLQEKDVSTQNGQPSTNSGHASTNSGHASNGHRSTTRRAMNQDRDRRQRDEGWTSFRWRNRKNPAPDNS